MLRWVPICLLALVGSTLHAQDRIEVDVELFLAVDVSRSMSPEELEIQRHGYAAALGSDAVSEAISKGMIGRIALTYVEWAGADAQTVVIPWTVIETPQQARTLARDITTFFSQDMRRTSISEALIYAADSFDLNGYTSYRRVIDISGDGPNNQGRPVLQARDTVLARGIVINGLPLMTRDAMSARWGIEDLDVYYTNCVIGGPGAFVVPVLNWDQFAAAVRRKLVLEIARNTPPDSTPLHAASAYDCLIGEKIWQHNRMDWMLP